MIRQQISQSLRLDVSYVGLLIATASHRYKRYRIPKKTGGMRIIDHPAKELKLIQKWLCRKYLNELPTHSSVYSYKSNINIRMHAARHVKNNYLMRVDFENYFPSIRAANIRALLKEHLSDAHLKPFPNQDIDDIVKLVCRHDALTIGAPSSPVLSNAVLVTFDTNLHEFCARMDVTYTRYADDIYFSTNTPGVLEGIHERLPSQLNEWTDLHLRINRDKTVFTSRKHERRVTGLILTSDKQVSVGRARKRQIKGLVYRYTQDKLDADQKSFLRGYLAYLHSVEPSFLQSLQLKYGSDAIGAILETKLVSRKKR